MEKPPTWVAFLLPNRVGLITINTYAIRSNG